jgi:hypothetical protein
MTERIAITPEPVQITSGSEGAHITVTDGFVLYADSADSTAWHRADRVINVSPPVALWMKISSGTSGAVVVTKYAQE